MEAIAADELKHLSPYFLRHKNIWTDFDQEADVLYIHFKKPSNADHSELLEDDIIVRYENEEVVGVSILNASKKQVV